MAKRKKKTIAQAGPGYRPQPGSDAGGHKGRMGEPIKWPPPPVKRVKKRNKLKIA